MPFLHYLFNDAKEFEGVVGGFLLLILSAVYLDPACISPRPP